MKKLYKLVSSVTDGDSQDITTLFVKYATGDISKEQLISMSKERRIQNADNGKNEFVSLIQKALNDIVQFKMGDNIPDSIKALVDDGRVNIKTSVDMLTYDQEAFVKSGVVTIKNKLDAALRQLADGVSPDNLSAF